MLIAKVIGVVAIWAVGIAAAFIVVGSVLSAVGAAIPLVAAATVVGALVGGACLGVGTAASRKL
jgi:CRISPR/Cas system-associated protein Cas5 (RAMP superfamily)